MKDKKIILCIICLVAILSIIIAFGVSQKDNAKDKTNKENQNNMQIELQEGSKIDVKNLENAKIENGMKVNNSPKAQEEKIVENLKYSEFSMDSKNLHNTRECYGNFPQEIPARSFDTFGKKKKQKNNM